MKILLFGEYSGFFNCLKDGLKELGHDVFLASNGDYYKDYPSDLRWDSHLHLGILQPFYEVFNCWRHRKEYHGYDVVLFISPSLFGYYPWLNRFMYKPILKNNKLTYLVSSGLYRYGFKFWHSKIGTKYYNYCHCDFLGCKNKHQIRQMTDEGSVKWEEEFMRQLTGIIPIWYEYAEPYREFPNLCKAIRTPININKFQYKPNKVIDGKVVFFHGLTRPCKGGEYIIAAFDKMREKHKDDAEFIAAGGLPFDEYMKIIDRTNVVVDDANSYSFCMNAFFSMLKGKIIMGGAEPEGNAELGYEDVPVVNICPDVDQICASIEYIIEHKNDIEAWGLKSRKFVERYHNYVDVAKDYENLFRQDLDKYES